jgi:hypothetical protein
LALWINQGPNSFLVNHWKTRELGVASANHHSWRGSHVVPTRPWFWGSTKKPFMTSSCRCWRKISTSHQAHSKPNEASLKHVPDPKRASQFSWNWQRNENS